MVPRYGLGAKFKNRSTSPNQNGQTQRELIRQTPSFVVLFLFHGTRAPYSTAPLQAYGPAREHSPLRLHDPRDLLCRSGLALMSLRSLEHAPGIGSSTYLEI